MDTFLPANKSYKKRKSGELIVMDLSTIWQQLTTGYWDFIWKSVVLITATILLLRISGRKSISQMTIAQTVIVISIGAIIVEPLVKTSVFRTIGAVTIFILFLIALEYLELKFNSLERVLRGKAIIIIEDGKLVPTNMKKLRLTVDALEMRLRQAGVTKIEDVKTATLESNGELGFELKRHAQPVTIGELEKILAPLLQQAGPHQTHSSTPSPQGENLFEEAHLGHHSHPIPKQLQ
jgi:uncharacterized membrane protein YcaP (DUF421 family)